MSTLKWLELSVEAPPEFVEPLSQVFYRYGHGGVAVDVGGSYNPDEGESPPVPERVTLKTFLPMNSTTNERRSRIDVGVRLIRHVGPVSPLQERVLDEEEWMNSWKQHFDPLRIGKRLVVCPSWRSYEPNESDIVVTLDPGLAFGTGHHPTTRMCLELLEGLVEPGKSVLDVGCGSGILSITAAKLGASGVFGLEVDSVAVGVAKRNALENSVSHGIRIAQGSLPHSEVASGGYHIAVANISAKVISEMAGDLVDAVSDGGCVIASGLLLESRSHVERALESAGACPERVITDGDWVTIVATKT